MRIINKFLGRNGEPCFTIEENGLPQPVTLKSIYTEFMLEGLVAAGYKIMNYHGDILTPEGINIKDLAEEQCIVSDAELNFMYDTENDDLLTEPEATKYFSRSVEISEIQLKEPKVEIETRQELLNYLIKAGSTDNLGVSLRDVRPLNSFVAREALFTVEELVQNQEVQDIYFNLIENRRKLKSYADYEQLISFLQAEGVLGEKYTADDVKRAYLSWGICGIKDSLVQVSEAPNSGKGVWSINENVSTIADSNREIEWCLMDKEGTIYYSEGKIQMEDYDLMDASATSVSPVDMIKYQDLLRTSGTWDTEYKWIRCVVTGNRIRTHYQGISSDGVSFRVKVDTGEMAIISGERLVRYSKYLTLVGLGGESVPLNFAVNKDMYAIWNLLYAKASDLIRTRTEQPPVSNSYELCLQEGLSPMAAVDYIGECIHDEPELNSAFLSDSSARYDNAGQLYWKWNCSKGLQDSELLSLFNPENLEYSSFDELIDIMATTRDSMIEKGEYLVEKEGMSMAEIMAIRHEKNVRIVDKLIFAKSVMAGDVTVSDFAAGKEADNTEPAYLAAIALATAVKRIRGKEDLSVFDVTQTLDDIEYSSIMSINDIVPYRSAAYEGYMKDRAKLNAKRVLESAYNVIVQRVFRERANCPVEKQRHYMFQCVSIPNCDKKNACVIAIRSMTGSIREAIANSKLPRLEKECADIEAPYYATVLAFNVLRGNVEILRSNKEQVVINLKLYLGNKLENLEVVLTTKDFYAAKDASNYYCGAYITLCDWCQYETDLRRINFTCLNADITPWYVRPKRGQALRTYPFAINYCTQGVLSSNRSKLGDDWYEKAISPKIKVVTIKDMVSGKYLLPRNTEEAFNMSNNYDESTISQVLDCGVEETPTHYFSRFNYAQANAIAQRKYIKRMLLKSDIIFENFKQACCPNPIGDADEVEDMVKGDECNLAIKDFTVELLTADGNVKQLNTMSNKVEPFKIWERKYYDVARWTNLINGEYKPYGQAIILGNNIKCITSKGMLTRNLYELTYEDALKLTEKGVFYQLGAREFLISTTRGRVTVTVV